MLLLCPACRTPLPEATDGRVGVLSCSHCAAEVDVSRAGTAAGRPRFVPELDRTGDEVGAYRLGVRVGSGGMGTVYRARKVDGTQDVAVKFLSPALAGEPDLVARFAREVKLLRALDHDAIVRVLDDGEAGGAPWYAMELVDGPDLRTRLGTGALPPAEVAAIFARVFAALAHAHARGVVHRDLKPGNVLLAPPGAKLADFGIARLDVVGGSAATRLTETAAIVGTFPYMSPEQRTGRDVDKRSDLFSVGVMLYEAATGRLPQGAFPPASSIERSFGAGFDRVVARLLHPDPVARFPDAESAGRALAAALRPPRRVARLVVAGAASVVAATLALLSPALTRLDFATGKASADQVKLGAEQRPSPPRTPAPLPPAPSPSAEPAAAQVDQTAQAQTPTRAQALEPPPVAIPVKGKPISKLFDTGARKTANGLEVLKSRKAPAKKVSSGKPFPGKGGRNGLDELDIAPSQQKRD